MVHHYEVLELLGEGGAANVYRVRHGRLGTEFALKVLRFNNEDIRTRLLQEGQIQARLRHPNIVVVTDVVEFDNRIGLIMEYVAGPTLDTLLKDRELTVKQVDRIGVAVLSGMALAHQQRLVHRDLKPANILCEIRDRALVPKIADFGIAKTLLPKQGTAATRAGTIMGTPSYMSPEQLEDSSKVDERTDVWSLGVLLYRMLANRVPFGGALLQMMFAVKQGNRQRLRDTHPHLPARMVEAVERALVSDRDHRVANAGDLLRIWNGEAVGPPVIQTWDGTLEEYGQSSEPLSPQTLQGLVDTDDSEPTSIPWLD